MTLSLKVNMDCFFEVDDGGGYSLCGHSWKLKVNRSRLQLRQCYFSQRVVRLWNMLPETVVEATSVNLFKKRLDEWSKDVDL